MTVFYGTPGFDFFSGTSADDTFFGLGGHDEFFGGTGNETFYGGAGDDFFYSSPGADLIYGEDGDDILFSADGHGPDHLDGGAGEDMVEIRRESFAGLLTLNMVDPTVLVTLADGTTLINVEQLEFRGGTGGNQITGAAGSDRLFGGDSDDLLDGSGGDDVLVGMAGSDRLIGGTGDDYMLGGRGDDTYDVDSFGDLLIEDEGGNDTVNVTLDGYQLPVAVENGVVMATQGLVLAGNDLDNRLTGGPGHDVLLASLPQWAGQRGADPIEDVDGDGQADLLQFGSAGAVHAWLSTGTSFSAPRTWAGSGMAPTDKFGDFDGDGKADLIRLVGADWGPDQKALVALSTGTAFDGFSQWGQNILPTDQVGDLNGDGRSDLVQFHINGRAYVWLSNGAGFDPYASWGDGTFRPSDRLADVNGDGMADAVGLSSGGVVSVRLSNGSGFDPISTSPSGMPIASRFGDFNGDGQDDLIHFDVSPYGPEQKGSVALSNGNGYDPAQVWGANFLPTDRIADVNGDGRSDVVQLHDNQNAYVWLSNGHGFEPYTVWGRGVGSKDQMADFNHDGLADVLHLGDDGVGRVGLSTGTGFGPPEVWGHGLLSGSGNDTLVGGDGNDHLVGGEGQDWLAGGGGSDELEGGAASDVFAYVLVSDRGAVGDHIHGFEAGDGGDVLDLRDLLTSIGAPHDSNAFSAGWLNFATGGGNTVVQVDSDGLSGPNPLVTLVTLSAALLSQSDALNYWL
ncbi:type 1 secretion C-terminal target domain protein [Burkholderiales bacterium JOSHI_001]|nr:type 1 secretion C-terminal target domain protein [Burkholderiales bacterium JOSHI_001]